MDVRVLAEGEVTRIDYDAEHGHRITMIRLKDPMTGVKAELRFTYPSPDWGEDRRGQNPVNILPTQAAPEITVVQVT